MLDKIVATFLARYNEFTIVLISAIFLFTGCINKQNKPDKKEIKNAITNTIYKLNEKLAENSGIIFWNGLIWSFNDSGGKNEIYAVDRDNAQIVQRVEINNATNIDWEDITHDSTYIYIGDTGNNLGNRKDLCIYKIAKSEITRDSVCSVKAEKIEISYADQTEFEIKNRNNKFDCESLLSYNNQLLLFSKDWVNGYTRMFSVKKTPGIYRLEAIDSFDVKGLATGADVYENGKIALLVYNYEDVFFWTFNSNLNSYFNNAKRFDLTEIDGAQTEGICFKDENTLYISCEKNPSFNQRLWEIDLNLLGSGI